jgi:hypothetical protein
MKKKLVDSIHKRTIKITIRDFENGKTDISYILFGAFEEEEPQKILRDVIIKLEYKKIKNQ